MTVNWPVIGSSEKGIGPINWISLISAPLALQRSRSLICTNRTVVNVSVLLAKDISSTTPRLHLSEDDPVSCGMLTAPGPGSWTVGSRGNTVGFPGTKFDPSPNVYGSKRLVETSIVRATLVSAHLITIFSMSYSFLRSIMMVGSASPWLLHVVPVLLSNILNAVLPCIFPLGDAVDSCFGNSLLFPPTGGL